MKTKILLIAILFLIGCNNPVDNFRELHAPIVLVSRDNENVLVVDIRNRYVCIPEGYYLAKALSTLQPGDTLFYFKHPELISDPHLVEDKK
jgi:hypothetical protein